MATITASKVKELRESTGAGMMACKEALVHAEGNFEKAIEFLRKKGQKVAAKRADRASTEGAVIAKVNTGQTKGVIVSLNCETDFVAKNESFVTLAHQITELALSTSSKSELLSQKLTNDITVADKLIEQTGVIGEKIEIADFRVLEAPFVGSYIHAGNKIAVLTGLSSNSNGADVVAKDVAMQAAAMNPIALDEKGVDQSTINNEIEIAKEQLRQEGKPESMLDNIAKGKIKRFFKDNTLVNQVFIKDNKKTVSDYVKSIGNDVTIVAFERVALA